MYQLTTFGTLSIGNGSPDHAGARSRSRLAILAVIAAAGDRGVRREKLAALFWPDSDEERARNALRQSLYALRRDLGGAEITLGTNDLRLNPAVISADVAEFDAAIGAERLAEAAELYRGAFLDGVSLREAPEFDRWVDEQRARLAADYARVLERLASAAANPETAVAWWAQAAAHDLLSARVARRYMESLAMAGDRESAIRHAAVYAAAVRSEIEAEPDAGILQYAEHLRHSSSRALAVQPSKVQPSRVQATAAAEAAAPAAKPIASTASGPPESVPHTPPVLPASPQSAQPSTPALPAGVVSRRPALLVGMLVLAIAGVAAFTSLTAPDIEPPRDGLLETVAITAISNQSGDSTLDQFAQQITAGVREHLVVSGHVRIVDPDGLTGSGTEALLRGELRRVGGAPHDSLLVILDVLSARDRRVLRVLGPVTSDTGHATTLITNLQQLVTGALAALSDSTFLPWTTANSRPPRYNAYLAFLRGLEGTRMQSPADARPHLEEAMRLDPDFPEAKVWFLEVADALDLDATLIDSVRSAAMAQRDRLGAYDQLRLERQTAFLDGRLEDMYSASRRMVAIAPEAPDSWLFLLHAAMATRRYSEVIAASHRVRDQQGWTRRFPMPRSFDVQAHRLSGSVSEGLSEWRAARAESPTDYSICLEGVQLFATARQPLAVDSLVTVCNALPTAPPGSEGAWVVAGRQLRGSGDTLAARRAFERLVTIREHKWRKNPNQVVGLAGALAELGDWRRVHDLLHPMANPSEPPAYVMLGIAAAHLGDTATASAVISWLEARERQARRPALLTLDRAFVLAALGRKDDAIAAVKQAASKGSAPAFHAWYVRFELDPLRSDPRFQAMIVPR